MEKRILIVIALLSVTLSMALTNPDNNKSKEKLCRLVSDSIYSVMKGHPAIVYSYGHYGNSWSLISRIDDEFRAFSGKHDYSGNSFLTENTPVNQFDSTLLFSINRDLILWGLDTLSTESINMQPFEEEISATLYSNLYVFNADGVNVFDSENAVTFSGPDSLKFNNNYNRLCLLMYWLASPRIRQYIPDSAIWQ